MNDLKHTPALLDSLGRKNRKNPDKNCPSCKNIFRPHRASSKYCSRKCAWENNGKVSSHNRKAEVWWKNSMGYISGRVWVDGVQINVRQHRWIMEKHLQRKLSPEEDVHHINGIKTDNRIENLEVMSHADHSKHHNFRRVYSKGYRLKLSDSDREGRSIRAKAFGLHILGQAAIAKATGKESA